MSATSLASVTGTPADTDTNPKAVVPVRALSPAELARRIDDLINLKTLIQNSFPIPDSEYATQYALRQMDIRLAELLDYYSDDDAQAVDVPVRRALE